MKIDEGGLKAEDAVERREKALSGRQGDKSVKKLCCDGAKLGKRDGCRQAVTAANPFFRTASRALRLSFANQTVLSPP